MQNSGWYQEMGAGRGGTTPDAARNLPDPANAAEGRLALSGHLANVGIMQGQLDQCRELVRRHAAADDKRLPIPRFSMRMGVQRTGPLPHVYEAMLCFVLQGAKRVTIGDRVHEYSEPSYLLASVDLPSMGEVVQASPEEPYMAIAIPLDSATVAGLLLDLDGTPEGASAPGFAISPLTPDLVDPLLRLLRLLDTPQDISVLAPMLEREMLYRVLQGPQGAMLRQIGRADSRLAQIRRAVAWIRGHFAESLRIEQLADLAGMSVSSFHRHFRSVTAMSPLQYHKQIRLQEARRILLARPGDAVRVAFAVGYESASQFSREYARQFGLPPLRDAARLRRSPEMLEDA